MSRALGVIVFSASLGCAAPRTLSAPAVDLAQDGLSGRTVYVDPRVDLTGYWARTKLGREVARALKLELDAAFTRAGYIIDSVDPELVVRLSVELSGSTKDVETF